MKPEERKILDDSLVKLFKITPEKLASLYNEAGDLIDFTPVIDLDAERVSRHSGEKNDQYKRGVKEGAQKIEREIKEKYNVESELVGIDLVDHIIVEKVSESKSSESIQKHPEFLAARAGWEKEQKARDREWQKKLDDKDREYQRSKIFDSVRTKALDQLAEAKPILPQDPRKAEQWKQIFIRELESGNYQIAEDGTILVLDKEGNALKDDHGYNKVFNEYTKELMEKYFEFQTAEQRSSSGNKEHSGTDKQFPKSEDERLTMLRDPAITPARRKELTEYVIK